MREKRIAQLRELLARDPNDSFSRYALALETAGMSELSAAMEILEDLIDRDPLYLPAYQMLGSYYAQASRGADAAAILRRGIDLARTQQDHHTLSEMEEALADLES